MVSASSSLTLLLFWEGQAPSKVLFCVVVGTVAEDLAGAVVAIAWLRLT